MTLMRQWRRLRRRWHRSVLSTLRSADATREETCRSGAERKEGWLSEIYGTIINAKRTRELAQQTRITPPTVPVLSIGNVTFGATGKTPMALWLTQYILNTKKHKVPMLLTRGYGDDEWRLFANQFPTCKLAVGSDRVRLGMEKAQEFAGELSCVILEDGLQQWRMVKDLEIVMVDALHPFGNGLLIPQGSLREKPDDALARADVIVVHHADLLGSPNELDELMCKLRSYTNPQRNTLLATSRMRVISLLDVDAIDDGKSFLSSPPSWNDLNDAVALVFCGVGNPESVEAVVRRMNCWYDVALEAFPDHHAFTQDDLCDIHAVAAELTQTTQKRVVLFTTEKDYFRSKHLLKPLAMEYELRILRCELELIENAEQVKASIDQILNP